MKKLKSTLLVESRKGNKYLYDRRLKKTILCHPLLHFLLRLMAEGENVEEWISQLQEGSVTIDGYGVCSKKELDYYYKKYLILKANGHFETIAQETRLSARLEPDDIKKSLANARQVTFEITERCGLQCEYCGYGKFYNDYDKRTNKDMDISSAIQLLNFLQKLWNSSLNHSHDRNIYLSFYGGEPLSHFSFIKENIFIDREEIEEVRPSLNDIYAEETINPLNFGHLTILADGGIYANVNKSRLGFLGTYSIYDTVFKEMKSGESWRLIRKNVLPCKSCTFEKLCPPISNYNVAIGKNNLCHIWSGK